MPTLSVVIPTRRRPTILRKALTHLAAQTIADELEVIVVHDGEDDGLTRQELRDPRQWPFPLTYFAIPKGQQGIARNRGVEKATAPLVLFIGDDIFLDPDACEAHVRAHEHGEGAAVLGFTTWDPDCRINDVMHWLELVGWQFGYPMIERYAHLRLPAQIQPSYTYTSFISLPTDIAMRIRFREDVALYGWEDIEWGLRLRDANVGLIYEPDAKALHHHHMELYESLQRMETLGRSAVVMERHSRGLQIVPRGLKRIVYRLIALLPTFRGEHAAAFLKGIDEVERAERG